MIEAVMDMKWFVPNYFCPPNDDIVEVPLTISSAVASDLINLAKQCAPYEACGVIHEHGIVHQYPNKFSDPAHGFDMELPLNDPTIRYIWHTHPNNGMEIPSRDDTPHMKLLCEYGFDFQWLIVTFKTVRQFVVSPQQENTRA